MRQLGQNSKYSRPNQAFAYNPPTNFNISASSGAGIADAAGLLHFLVLLTALASALTMTKLVLVYMHLSKQKTVHSLEVLVTSFHEQLATNTL